jgi:hypothetical protein
VHLPAIDLSRYRSRVFAFPAVPPLHSRSLAQPGMTSSKEGGGTCKSQKASDSSEKLQTGLRTAVRGSSRRVFCASCGWDGAGNPIVELPGLGLTCECCAGPAHQEAYHAAAYVTCEAAAAATTASSGDAGTGVPILLGTAEGWERAHRTGLLEKLETGVKGGEQPGELEALGDMRAGTPNFRDTSLPSTSSGPHDGAFGQPNPRELQRRKKSRVEDGSRFFRRPSLGVAATQPSDVASPRLRSTSSDEPAVAHAQQTSQQYEDDFAKRERNEARSPIARKTPKGSWAHANKGGGLRKQLIRELKTRDRENI